MTICASTKPSSSSHLHLSALLCEVKKINELQNRKNNFRPLRFVNHQVQHLNRERQYRRPSQIANFRHSRWLSSKQKARLITASSLKPSPQPSTPVNGRCCSRTTANVRNTSAISTGILTDMAQYSFAPDTLLQFLMDVLPSSAT